MIKATRLRTNGLINPLGIDNDKYLLTWNVSNAQKQTACEIEFRINDIDPIFVRRESDSMRFEFPEKLKDKDTVVWSVRLTDENGVVGEWSETANFEIGISSWQAKWICGDYVHSGNKKMRYPADYFKKEFEIVKGVRKARLYITACGIYRATINGVLVGNFVLAPGSTAFHKRTHYQVYDITELIESRNCLQLTLGDGWYAGSNGCFNHTKYYGFEPKLIAQLEIEEVDGHVTVIGTDHAFDWSNDGQVRFNDLKAGETFDSNCTSSYSGKARETTYEGVLSAGNKNAIVETERFSAKTIITPNGQTVLDFGQNISGYLSFHATGYKGAKTVLVCGEKLNDDGNFTQCNILMKGDYLDSRFQTIEYISNGEPEEYKTAFTYFGFRYCLLLEGSENVSDVTAIAISSNNEKTYDFDCSDERVRKIVQNTERSMIGNFVDVPTDCPTREKAGWTGDAQLFFNTGAYMYDVEAFYSKWISDVTDVQKKNGMVYNINPNHPSGNRIMEWIAMEGSCGWGDALISIPYDNWQRYGNDSLIRKYWPHMERCLHFFLKRLGIINAFSLFMLPLFGKHRKYVSGRGRDFGEWTEPKDCAPSKMSLLLPNNEISTAYIARSLRIMCDMAKHIGKEEESMQYGDLFNKVREAYRYYFVNDNLLKTKQMSRLVRPVAFDLCSESEKKRLIDAISALNHKRDYQIGTGFLSTKSFFDVMTENGCGDAAFRVLVNDEAGWVKQINSGATTIWENWTDDASLNHYSKGSCCEWLFGCLCGVRFNSFENHFFIVPHIISALTSIGLAYNSKYGRIISKWEKVNNQVIFRISVPGNCHATVQLPDGRQFFCSSGEHNLSCVLDKEHSAY